MEKEKVPHVAFVDRLGLNKIWHDCIKRCTLSFGTSAFPTDVTIFENTLINVRDGVALYNLVQEEKQKIREWINSELDEWIEEHEQESQSPSFIRDQRDGLVHDGCLKQYHFMVQLLEDKGFGSYKSEYGGEYDKWE